MEAGERLPFLGLPQDCEKAGNFTASVLLPSCGAGNIKEESQHLASSQSCTAHFIQEKDATQKGYSRCMSLSWYPQCFTDIKKKKKGVLFGRLIFYGLPPLF